MWTRFCNHGNVPTYYVGSTAIVGKVCLDVLPVLYLGQGLSGQGPYLTFEVCALPSQLSAMMIV